MNFYPNFKKLGWLYSSYLLCLNAMAAFLEEKGVGDEKLDDLKSAEIWFANHRIEHLPPVSFLIKFIPAVRKLNGLCSFCVSTLSELWLPKLDSILISSSFSSLSLSTSVGASFSISSCSDRAPGFLSNKPLNCFRAFSTASCKAYLLVYYNAMDVLCLSSTLHLTQRLTSLQQIQVELKWIKDLVDSAMLYNRSFIRTNLLCFSQLWQSRQSVWFWRLINLHHLNNTYRTTSSQLWKHTQKLTNVKCKKHIYRGRHQSFINESTIETGLLWRVFWTRTSFVPQRYSWQRTRE